ncbi:MAG TPA: redoxin family protein [Planosporangium sp.]|nr:redoxin family protein [Planosporangium sp.]
MRVRLILPALVTAALVALAGCGAGGVAATGSGSADSAASATSHASATAGAVPATPGVVPATLAFTATTLDGKAFDGASLAGRPVVLWFWAPWCATCAGQAASVSELAAEYKGKVDIVGVAGMGDEKEMHAFVSDLGVGAVTHLSDKAGVVWKRFGVTQQSVYVLLDRSGKVVVKGFMDSQQFSTRVAGLAAA